MFRVLPAGRRVFRLSAAAIVLFGLSTCGEQATLPVSAGYGPDPVLPPPRKTLFPTVKVADVKRWQDGEMPTPRQDLAVTKFAGHLDHPRWVYALPNGDVLVAESDAPPRPKERTSIKGWIFGLFQKKAGAGNTSANRITLLRDGDGDGVAEFRSILVSGLNSPFGMALVGEHLFIANTDGVVRVPYKPGQDRIVGEPVKVADLPAGPRNHHWTKNIIASPDGTHLYATVGSNSNVAENGLEEEDGRAAVWEIDLKTGEARVFASGLRNPNGMAWEPMHGTLWTVVNERDEIGSDLVPDYMTSVRDGGFYGWP